MRYAVPLLDLDAAWRTLAGSALVEAAVEDQDREAAEVVTLIAPGAPDGTEALVLSGPAPRVAAVVSGLVRARLPAPLARPVRVYAEGPRGWLPVSTPPAVPPLPDDPPEFEDREEAA